MGLVDRGRGIHSGKCCEWSTFNGVTYMGGQTHLVVPQIYPHRSATSAAPPLRVLVISLVAVDPASGTVRVDYPPDFAGKVIGEMQLTGVMLDSSHVSYLPLYSHGFLYSTTHIHTVRNKSTY